VIAPALVSEEKASQLVPFVGHNGVSLALKHRVPITLI
jgi:hypothetical protein